MASILWFFFKKRLYILFFYNEPAYWYLCHSWTPWEQEKMREAGHQGRRTRSGACSGVPVRAPGSSLLRRSQSAAQKCKHSHLCSPTGVSFPQIQSIPKEVSSPLPPFPWLCPWIPSSPRCGLSLTVHQLYPGIPLRWELGTSHSFSKRLLFYLGGPRRSPGWVCRTPSISPQRWGERFILRATGQQYPRQKRQVTGSQVTPTLQQQELQTAWNPDSWVPERALLLTSYDPEPSHLTLMSLSSPIYKRKLT